MMLGEPPWPVPDDETAPLSPDSTLRFFLLPPYADASLVPYTDVSDGEPDDLDAYACDQFRMYEFKVRRCTRSRSHDWTECPFAHPGEKARRRDPRKYRYSGAACPDFRKGGCRKGDACEFSHGVFECWLHPSRYRTQACKDGINCRRRVCFFAHTREQLRVLPQHPVCGSPPRSVESYDGSPLRLRSRAGTLASGSPPPSPTKGDASQLLGSLRLLQLGGSSGRPAWGLRGCGGSAPATPTGLGLGWGEPLERVESGRDLRARIAERLSRENPLVGTAGPDVNWVSDLIN